jgi:hypothetical protein
MTGSSRMKVHDVKYFQGGSFRMCRRLKMEVQGWEEVLWGKFKSSEKLSHNTACDAHDKGPSNFRNVGNNMDIILSDNCR